MKKQLLALLAFIFAFLSVPAMAAVDAGVTTALTDAKADIATVGLAVFVIALAIALYKWFKRAL